jgi:hypothetical protein
MDIADSLYVCNMERWHDDNDGNYVATKEFCFTCAVKKIMSGIRIEQEVREKPLRHGHYRNIKCCECDAYIY